MRCFELCALCFLTCAFGPSIRAQETRPSRDRSAPSEPDAGKEHKPDLVRDVYGDVIPNSATARFGTMRLRVADCSAFTLSGDGRLLATAEKPSRVRIWRTDTGQLVSEFDARGTSIVLLAFSSDKRALFALSAKQQGGSVSFESRLLRFDLEAKRFVNSVNLRSRYSLYSAREMTVASDTRSVEFSLDDYLFRFDLAGAPIEPTVKDENEWDLPNGKWTLTASAPDRVLKFHQRNGTLVSIPWEYGSCSLLESPSGNRIVMLATEPKEREDSMIVLDGQTGRKITSFSLGRRWLSRQRHPMALLDDERLLTVDTDPLDDRFAVFNIDRGKFVDDARIPAWTASWDKAYDDVRRWVTNRYVISNDRRALVYLDHHDTFRIWNLAAGKEVVTASEGHTAPVLGMEFTQDTSRLLTWGADRTVRLWDAASTKLLWSESCERPMKACFSPDFKNVLAYESGGMKVLDVASGKQVVSQSRMENDPLISSAQFGPDGRTFWLADRNGNIEQWSIESKKRQRTIKVPRYKRVTEEDRRYNLLQEPLNAGSNPYLTYPVVIPHWQGPCVLSPHDRRGLSALDTISGQELLRVDAEPEWWSELRTVGHRNFLASIVLAPGEPVEGDDGTVEMKPARKHTIRVYSAIDCKLQHSLTVDSVETRAIAMSADGRLLACGDAQLPVLQIIRVSDSRVVQRITRLPALVSSLAFSADGKQIAAGLVDSQILTWNVSPLEK